MKWHLDNTRVTFIFYILFFGLSHFAFGIFLWSLFTTDLQMKKLCVNCLDISYLTRKTFYYNIIWQNAEYSRIETERIAKIGITQQKINLFSNFGHFDWTFKTKQKNHKKFESIDFIFLNDKSEDFPWVQNKFQNQK